MPAGSGFKRKLIIFSFVLVISLSFFYFRLSRYKGFFFNTKGMRDFMEKGIINNPEVDCFVEDDYFSKNNFKNGSFVDGLCYWGTDVSENLFLLECEDYVSPPYSLKIIAKEFPCRLYYIKNKKFEKFKILPWAFKNSAYWLGIKGGKRLRASFFYKGAKPLLYVNVLQSCGNGRVLAMNSDKKYSLGWEKVELFTTVPEYSRAVSLEITLDNGDYGDFVLIDDVELTSI